MSAASSASSATVLLSQGLTPGKLRGLQRISNPDGTLTMLALDQNASMIDLAAQALKSKGHDRPPTYEEIVDAKLDLARQMSPAASGVLIDAYYGAWAAVASLAVPAAKGLLVRLEKSGAPKNKAGGILGQVEPGWSVEKIKLMGADAVKLLAQFEPGEPASAEHQLAFAQQVYEDCKRHDILMLLEPISYPLTGESKADPAFRDRKARTVLESARQLSRYCDIFKVEFPGTLGVESVGQLTDNLHALSEASARPWVLLSAGVDYAEYQKQVRMALPCGCSGVLGGRAFWKEYFLEDGPATRSRFAAETGRPRVAEIDDLVRSQGTPWFKRYGLSLERLHSLRPAEGWHARYAPQARSAPGLDSGLPFYKPGEVY
jgi:tagatose 1,6-diphosphate aldolase